LGKDAPFVVARVYNEEPESAVDEALRVEGGNKSLCNVELATVELMDASEEIEKFDQSAIELTNVSATQSDKGLVDPCEEESKREEEFESKEISQSEGTSESAVPSESTEVSLANHKLTVPPVVEIKRSCYMRLDEVKTFWREFTHGGTAGRIMREID